MKTNLLTAIDLINRFSVTKRNNRPLFQQRYRKTIKIEQSAPNKSHPLISSAIGGPSPASKNQSYPCLQVTPFNNHNTYQF